MGGFPIVTHHDAAGAEEDRLTELDFIIIFFFVGEHVLNLLQLHQTNARSSDPFPLRPAGQRDQKFVQ